MPAYPFHALPTFAEFKEKLAADYQVEYIEGCQIQKGSDDPHAVWYFKRAVAGSDLTYVFDTPNDNELISFHIIRSVCKHLKIPFQKDGLYGLYLG